jgi:hypothetical protein
MRCFVVLLFLLAADNIAAQSDDDVSFILSLSLSLSLACVNIGHFVVRRHRVDDVSTHSSYPLIRDDL